MDRLHDEQRSTSYPVEKFDPTASFFDPLRLGHLVGPAWGVGRKVPRPLVHLNRIVLGADCVMELAPASLSE